MKRFVARALIVVAAILGMMFAQVAPASADAPDDPSGKLTRDLAALWTAVLQTDASENPAVNPDAGPACWDLGHRTVAQFGFVPNEPCTVKPGTKIFVAAYSGECSTFDGDCGRGSPGGCTATTAPGLLACTQDIDKDHAPDKGLKVTIDGKPLPLTEVNVPELNIQLPDYNVFDVLNGTEAPDTPGGPGLSAAHGWVALLNPLTPGSHEIVIDDPIYGEVTTTIIVTTGH